MNLENLFIDFNNSSKLLSIFNKYLSNENIKDLYDKYNNYLSLTSYKDPIFKNEITKEKYLNIIIYHKFLIIYNNKNNKEFQSFISDILNIKNIKNNKEFISDNLNIKYKKKNIPSALKRVVWNKYIGENIGKSKCLCCNLTDITQMSFHCGHIIAEINGGSMDVNNLKPICQNCNSSMGSKNMNDFIKLLK